MNPLRNVVRIDGILSSDKCNAIVEAAETHGKWQTKRHNNYPTTDIPIGQLKGVECDNLLDTIVQLTKSNYHLGDDAILEPFDVFVVKYSKHGQAGLETHRDVSELSFVLLLSDPKNFEGGGTHYEERNETVCPEQGSVVLHCGKVRHAGSRLQRVRGTFLSGFLK